MQLELEIAGYWTNYPLFRYNKIGDINFFSKVLRFGFLCYLIR